MIPRYTRPEMASIWEPQTRFKIWFEIEAHAADAQAELGVIPKEAAKTVWAKARNVTFDIARITRASPVRFSDSTGLRLCGIADEPFWPSAKYSEASRSSVRCRWRNSVAKRSTAAAVNASAMKNAA